MPSLSIRLFVTFLNSIKINNTSLENFSLSGSHTILVFAAKRHGDISTETPLMGALNAGGVDTNHVSEPISGFIACCQCCDRQVLSARSRRTVASCNTGLIAGSKWRSLLMAGEDGEMFMTRSLNVMPKTTEQHLLVRNDKSVATNNKRLCSTFCTVEANYWQTRSITRPLCDTCSIRN